MRVAMTSLALFLLLLLQSLGGFLADSNDFVRIWCYIPDNVNVKWQMTTSHQTLKSRSDLFAFVESSEDKKKVPQLVLYIRPTADNEGVYVCNNVFWQVQQGMPPKVLQGADLSQFSDWIGGADKDDDLTWKERFDGVKHAALNLPIYVKIIMGATLLIYCMAMVLMCFISRKLIEASETYSKIAFIMLNGDRVRTLEKLRRQFINKPHSP